jgi:molybdopterin molybdotransferase
MLSVREAQARVLDGFRPLPSEWLPLAKALGRVLAGDLRARRDQPPAPVSAMDGYAVRAADLEEPGRPLEVIGQAPAGHPFPGPLAPGQAVRIFTGGVMPEGADAVAIQENAERDGSLVRFTRGVRVGEFVRPAGLDFPAGWTGLAAGTVLGPRELGLAAVMGHAFLPVRRRPRVGILATGDELRWPGESPGPGEIVSSNSTALAAMVTLWGGEPVDLGISRDEPAALAASLAQVEGLDALVTSGGASVGDHDLVQDALGVRGLSLTFWKIAMRPGKPLIFGRLGTTPVLGLPGNPVSSAVCAILFLRGGMRRGLGLDPALPREQAVLARALPANDTREDYMRARYVDGPDARPRRVEAAGRQDSSMFATFAKADALVVRPPHDAAREAGEAVEVIDLRTALAGLG